MRTNMQKFGRRLAASSRFRFLTMLLGFSISLATLADAASDYVSLGCQGCHGPAASFDLSSYTNDTLKTKIDDTMPADDPSACEDSTDGVEHCATDLANYLLPPTPGTPPKITTRESNNLVGTGPLNASFSARLSQCEATPCVLEWKFEDGTTITQTTTVPTSLTPVPYTFSTLGPHKVEVKMTDFLGQEDNVVLYAYVTTEESFESYVDTCKEELEFNDDDIPNDLNCADGFLFGKNSGVINDYVDYRKVTGSVDLVFACRWLQNGTGINDTDDPPFILSRSIELLLHNRENGNTCFFRAREHNIPVTGPLDPGGLRIGSYVDIVSPTVAAAALPGTPEAEYWIEPLELAKEIPCVDCHIAGPYIASPRIAPFLQQFGLLNDGHDTLGRELFDEEEETCIDSEVIEGSCGKYHVVGETLGFMNHFAAFNNERDTCAGACHSIGENSVAGTIVASPLQSSNPPVELIPSIAAVIGSVGTAGVMPANAPLSGTTTNSHYTWINRDNPYTESSEGDNETFAEAKKEFSDLLDYCGAPGSVYAHVVDSDEILLPQPFSDHLSVFNPQDGVICRKSEQSDGQCNNFRVRYQCTDSVGNVSTTGWYNTDSPSGEGDFERRSDHANVCTGMQVTGIEASSTISTGWTGPIKGPVDRFAQFDRYGLVCKNSEQADGQCENYVVKFIGCSEAPEAYTARLRSAWSGRVLTASDTYNNALTKAQPSNSGWSSQDWMIEPVTNTGYVRLKNLWSGTYLNSQSDAEFADIVVYDFVEEWGSQQWIIEHVYGTSDVRFKNVWTGKYLTVNSTGDYADIKSQALNLSWPSQRWQIY